jgi:hypothetical protein
MFMLILITMKHFLMVVIALATAHFSYSQFTFPCANSTYPNMQWQCLGPFSDSNKLSNQNFGSIQSICAHPTNDSMDIYIGSLSGGLWHTMDGGAHWKNLTDVLHKNTGGVCNIIVDFNRTPRKISIGTGSNYGWIEANQAGVLYSNDGGNHWQYSIFKRDNADSFLPNIDRLIQDKTNPTHFYASTAGSIWRSMDDCISFEKIFPITDAHKKIFNREPHNKISSIVFDEPRQQLLLGTDHAVIFDGVGKRYLPGVIVLRQLNKPAGKVSAFDVSSMIEEKTPLEPTQYCEGAMLKICDAQPDILHLFKTYTNGTQLLKIVNLCLAYNDSVQIINPRYPEEGFSAQMYAGLQCNHRNEAVHYLTGWTLNKSLDSCHKFVPQYGYSYGEFNVPHTDIRSCLVTKSSKDGTADHLLLGTDGGLSFSNNSGKSFRNINGASLPITQFYGVGVSAFDGKISAGAQDNSIMTYVPAKKEWIVSINGDGYDVEYSNAKKSEVYGEYNYQILQKSNNGEAPMYNNSNLNHTGENNPSKNLKSLYNGNMYFGGGNQIHKKTPESKNWIPTSTLPNISNSIFSYDVCPANENIIYACNIWPTNQSNLLKTTDGGKTWQDISSALKIDSPHKLTNEMYRILKIYCSPNNQNDVWLGLGYNSDYTNLCNGFNRVLHSANGGDTWVDESKGLTVHGVSDIVQIEGTEEAMFAATNEGVYFKESKNDEWQLYGSGQPFTFVSELKIDYCAGNLVMSTYGRGLWQVALPDKISYDHTINSTKEINFSDSNQVYVVRQNIELRKNETLQINGQVYMAKNRKIRCYRANQIVFGAKGMLLNGCHQNENFIEIRKPRKKVFGIF